MSIHYPKYQLVLVGRSDQDPTDCDQTAGVQFAIQTPDGDQHVYGDQSWVAHGVAIRDGSHPAGRVVWRTISISYGKWEADPTDELLARARTHLVQCGPHDYGVDSVGCNCPAGDPRSVIADLVAEIERLRAGGDP